MKALARWVTLAGSYQHPSSSFPKTVTSTNTIPVENKDYRAITDTNMDLLCLWGFLGSGTSHYSPEESEPPLLG